ncbi:MAG: acyl-CoA dehydrogenase family protein [Pseudomonadota bacterium]
MNDKGYIKGGAFLLEKTAPADVTIPEDMTDEHRMILQTSRDFVEKEIQPHIERVEKKDAAFARELLRKAGELGLLGTDVPEAYGGLGLDKFSTALVTEAFGAAGSFATSQGAHTGIATLPIVFFGTEEQKKKYLPGLAQGEFFGSYALTEPSAGSDAMGGCKTSATLSPDGKHYLLNGQKIFISNAAWSKTFITYAKVDGRDFTAFIVERDFPGVSVGPEEGKMGIKGSSTCTLILDNARVPVENVLHDIGKGHQVAFNILNVGRYKLGAATVGGCKSSLKNSVEYAKIREQFGQPICRFGAIQEKLADLSILTYFNESIVYRSAGLFESILSSMDKNDPAHGHKAAAAIHEYAIECSIDKVYGSEALGLVVDEGVQILGGYGYIDEYPAERAYRDARINRIYEGTNEVNRLIILGELIRRGLKGDLPVFEAADKVFEELKTLSPTPEIPEGPLGLQEYALERCKKATLLTAAVAAGKFGANLTREQEVVTRISNMILEIFVMESGLLRAQKVMAMKGPEAAPFHAAAVKAYVDDRMPRIEAWAKAALAHVEQGAAPRDNLSSLQKIMNYQPIDAISLKREIADRAIERGGYPI